MLSECLKTLEEDKIVRKKAIEAASQYAAEVPFKVMETCNKSIELFSEMATKGNKASISDVGVGALCSKTAIEGAFMNVMINIKDLGDRDFANELGSKSKKP